MTQQTEQAEGLAQRWGHHWREAERVQWYIERTDRQAAERAESFKYVVGLIPFDHAHPLRILDVGSGHGVVAAALLDAFPSGSAVGLDVSEPMMDVGRERMARFGSRFTYHVGDFADGDLPGDLPGPFDAVVSAAAIHHLPAPSKQRLYQAVFSLLTDGGCFFNLDMVLPGDEYLKEIYREAGDFVRGEPQQRPPPLANPTSSHMDSPDTLDDQLRFLTEAGFTSVDCFWKHLGSALVGGYKRR